MEIAYIIYNYNTRLIIAIGVEMLTVCEFSLQQIKITFPYNNVPHLILPSRIRTNETTIKIFDLKKNLHLYFVPRYEDWKSINKKYI